MGRPVIVAKPAKACDLEFFTHWGFKDQKLWRATLVPEELQFRNGEGYKWGFGGRLRRVDSHPVQSMVHDTRNVGEKFKAWADKIEISGGEPPIQDNLVATGGALWEVEVWAVLGPQKKRLYKGPPTSVTVV